MEEKDRQRLKGLKKTCVLFIFSFSVNYIRILYTFEYLLLNMWEILHFNVAILSHTGVIESEKVLTHINTRTNTNLLLRFLGFHKCICFVLGFFLEIYIYIRIQ